MGALPPKGKTWCRCGHHKRSHAPTDRISGTSCLVQECRCTRYESAATTGFDRPNGRLRPTEEDSG